MHSDATVTGPINLGNPEEFQIKQLAEYVIEMTGSGSTLLPHPLPSDDPKQRKPEIALAQSLLGWNPTIELKVGLQQTIAYFNALI
jgi:UDP-glucuronate decarboxylase